MLTARRLQFKVYPDARGVLLPVELNDGSLPFVPVRMFVIADVPAGASRACHASSCDELLLCVQGAMTVDLDTGDGPESLRLSSAGEALYVPRGIWIAVREFSATAVLQVFASASYADTRQLGDHAQYLAHRRAGTTWW